LGLASKDSRLSAVFSSSSYSLSFLSSFSFPTGAMMGFSSFFFGFSLFFSLGFGSLLSLVSCVCSAFGLSFGFCSSIYSFSFSGSLGASSFSGCFSFLSEFWFLSSILSASWAWSYCLTVFESLTSSLASSTGARTGGGWASSGPTVASYDFFSSLAGSSLSEGAFSSFTASGSTATSTVG
jgi:hypothetical protein